MNYSKKDKTLGMSYGVMYSSNPEESEENRQCQNF